MSSVDEIHPDGTQLLADPGEILVGHAVRLYVREVPERDAVLQPHTGVVQPAREPTCFGGRNLLSAGGALPVAPLVGQAESARLLREDPIGLPHRNVPFRREVDGGGPGQHRAPGARIDDVVPQEREEVVRHGGPAVDRVDVGDRTQPAEGGCPTQCFTRADPRAQGDRPEVPGRRHRPPGRLVLPEVEEGQFVLGADVVPVPVGHGEGQARREGGELGAGVGQFSHRTAELGRGAHDAAEVLGPMPVEDRVRVRLPGPGPAPDDGRLPGLAFRAQKAGHDVQIRGIGRPVEVTGPDGGSGEPGMGDAHAPRGAQHVRHGHVVAVATTTALRQSPRTSAAMSDQPGCGTG